MQIKLLNVDVDNKVIQANQIELSDTIRFLLYQRHPNWLNLLAYDNDDIFLEPSLFYYFSEKSAINLQVEQLLFGYLSNADRPKQFAALSDCFGQIFLPNYGLIQAEYPCSTKQLEFVPSTSRLYCSKEIVVSDVFAVDSSVNLRGCQHLPFILFNEKSRQGHFVESPLFTLKRYQFPFDNAITILQRYIPEFWQLIQQVVREFSIFHSSNIRSMAAMSYHGTAFINTEGHAHDEVFFVEDIAHQCGHVIFYALTLHTEEFIKIDKETTMSSLTGIAHDTHSVYGTFHGLFTYTTILHCLSKCIELGVFTPSQSLEALARIGFFMQKFKVDLRYMDMPGIFTPKGQHIYDGARVSFELVRNNFETDYKQYRYDNQPYIFNYELFHQTNLSTDEKFGIFFNH